MDIESLRLFVLVSEQLSISGAGRSLAMSAATASTRLAKLEAELREIDRAAEHMKKTG